MKVKYFEDLEIWEMARELTKFKDKTRRVSVSIMSNIERVLKGEEIKNLCNSFI